ncbi:MAG: manganese-binding transcriptional regulator MntR [Phycisphaerae bacterium]|nr:manganese-binding transcriptional regulator MntR [Phycisphaerae bacterium]
MPTTLRRKKSTAPTRSALSTVDGHRRTRSDHAREIAEDYVELIDDLIRERGEARAVDVATHLGVTQVTVTKTINRLKREGLVTSKPYRSIFLTNEGKALADFTRERHRTVLDFLIALGVPRADAEIDAEGIEHHLSPRTLEAMRRYSRKPKSSP